MSVLGGDGDWLATYRSPSCSCSHCLILNPFRRCRLHRSLVLSTPGRGQLQREPVERVAAGQARAHCGGEQDAGPLPISPQRRFLEPLVLPKSHQSPPPAPRAPADIRTAELSWSTTSFQAAMLKEHVLAQVAARRSPRRTGPRHSMPEPSRLDSPRRYRRFSSHESADPTALRCASRNASRESSPHRSWLRSFAPQSLRDPEPASAEQACPPLPAVTRAVRWSHIRARCRPGLALLLRHGLWPSPLCCPPEPLVRLLLRAHRRPLRPVRQLCR